MKEQNIKHTVENLKSNGDTPLFCGQCGAKIVDGNTFCIYCGAPLIKIAEKDIEIAETEQQSSQTSQRVKTPESTNIKSQHRSKPIILAVGVVLIIALIVTTIGIIMTHKPAAHEEPTISESNLGASSAESEAQANIVAEEQRSVAEEFSTFEESSKEVDPYADLPQNVVDGLQEASDDIDQQLFSEAFKCLKHIENADDYPEVAEMLNHCQYEWACYSASQGDYESAISRLKKLGDYEDAADRMNEFTYLWGQEYLDAGDNYNAYLEFSEIPDYSDVNDILEQLREKLYENAVETYEKGIELEQATLTNLCGQSTSDAKSYLEMHITLSDMAYGGDGAEYFSQAGEIFQMLDGYERSSDYNLLNRARTLELTSEEYAEFLNLMPFEDSCIIAVTSRNVSYTFLTGVWKNSNGSYYFSYNGKSVSYNLPANSVSGNADIMGGFYYVMSDYNHYKKFMFKAIDRNTLSVYCTQDGNTYTLYRQ